MRVLMLGWELPPHNSGGLGVACLQLTKALADSGADIEFILPYYDGQPLAHMRVNPVFNTPVAGLPDAYSQVSDFSFSWDGKQFAPADQALNFEDTVSYIAASREFDIIHAHDWLTFRAALRAKWESGKPLVVHVHSIERDRAGGQDGSPMVREIEATTMLLADQVIAVSEHTKRAIIDDYGVPAAKITVIHNSVNPEDFQPLQEINDYLYLSQMRQQGWKVISYVGRLTVQKGLTQLIRATAAALQRCPRSFLLFVGSGEQRDELLQLAADLGIADRVFFADFQRGKRLRDAFKLADLFVMPSVSEPFGLVALEAAGYGAPALISKQSGVSEVLKSCLKVDYWDVDELANQIAAVLQNPALGTELTSGARRELERLSWSQSAQKVLDLYQAQRDKVTA